AEAVGGQGNIIFLVGEAGIGKTRLLDELYAQLGDAASWCVVSPPSYAAAIPYSGIVGLVRALLEVDDRLPEPELRARIGDAAGRLGIGGGDAEAAVLAELLGVAWPERAVDSLDPANRKLFLIHTVVALVRAYAAERPLVLALEDLHFLDRSSHEVLNGVLRVVPNLPALVVGTYRPAWPNPWTNLPSNSLVRLHPL